MPTAGLVIIGNEILTGKFPDENGPWLIRRLRTLGCDLLRISIIPDALDEIAEEVALQSARFDWVFTTGGVGPTHDDITFAGVAQAFGLGLEHHPELVAVLRAKLGDRCNTAALKMAEVPVGSELWWDGGVIYPLTVVKNVCVFPGVPSLLQLKFEKVAHRFVGVPLLTRRRTTTATEPEIADTLTEAARRWPEVAIGSYPRLDETPIVVIVTLESRDEAALIACDRFLRAAGHGLE